MKKHRPLLSHFCDNHLCNNMKKILIIAIAGVALASCNVTRTVTTESRYIQRNDTNIVIQTKTIETYDASKKL